MSDTNPFNFDPSTPRRPTSSSASSRGTPISAAGASSTSVGSVLSDVSQYQSPSTGDHRSQLNDDEVKSVQSRYDRKDFGDSEVPTLKLPVSNPLLQINQQPSPHPTDSELLFLSGLKALYWSSFTTADVVNTLYSMSKTVKATSVSQDSDEDKKQMLKNYYTQIFNLAFDYERWLGDVSVVMTAFWSWLTADDQEFTREVAQKRVQELADLITKSTALIKRVHDLHCNVSAEEVGLKQGLVVELQQKAGLSAIQTSLATVAMAAGAGLLAGVGGALAAAYTTATAAWCGVGGLVSSLSAVGYTVTNSHVTMNVADLLSQMETSLSDIKTNLDELDISIRKLNALVDVPKHDKPKLVGMVQTIQNLADQGRQLVKQVKIKAL